METTIAPDTAEFYIVAEEIVGFAKETDCENVTLKVRPIVTIKYEVTPVPADARHRTEESANHCENKDDESPIRTGPLGDICPRLHPETMT
jgi:hypothetical protein